jgi:hypothetical protein
VCAQAVKEMGSELITSMLVKFAEVKLGQWSRRFAAACVLRLCFTTVFDLQRIDV